MEYLKKEKNVPILVCKPCAEARKIKEEDLVENAKIDTGYALIELAMESQTLVF